MLFWVGGKGGRGGKKAATEPVVVLMPRGIPNCDRDDLQNYVIGWMVAKSGTAPRKETLGKTFQCLLALALGNRIRKSRVSERCKMDGFRHHPQNATESEDLLVSWSWAKVYRVVMDLSFWVSPHQRMEVQRPLNRNMFLCVCVCVLFLFWKKVCAPNHVCS